MKVTLTLDPSFQKSLQRVMDKLGASAAAQVIPRAQKIVDAAKERWPVRTGASKASFGVELVADDKSVTIRIRNKIGYVLFITEPFSKKSKRIQSVISKLPNNAKCLKYLETYQNKNTSSPERRAAKKPWVEYVSRPFTMARKDVIRGIEETVRKQIEGKTA